MQKEVLCLQYLLYNPFSGNNDSYEDALCYSVIADLPTQLVNTDGIHSISDFFDALEPSDDVVIFGGDGTLNRIINKLSEITVKNDVYFYPSGTGNDFARDIGQEEAIAPFLINQYIKDLPTVTVNGMKRRFINGTGLGIDGYCCNAVNQQQKEKKETSYALIALKGLIFDFKPVNAKVTIDGREMYFKRLWIASTMFGRFCGGGIKFAPNQDRERRDKMLSIMICHNAGKLKTLTIFPSVLNGKHEKHKKNIAILEGKSIKVKFDKPAVLQIDGETLLNVKEYSAEV